jgi:hypothetical protein
VWPVSLRDRSLFPPQLHDIHSTLFQLPSPLFHVPYSCDSLVHIKARVLVVVYLTGLPRNYFLLANTLLSQILQSPFHSDMP